MGRFDAILFDKDGTLLDFNATWVIWAVGFLHDLADDAAHATVLARAIGFDLTVARFAPDSPVIAGTSEQSAALLLPHLTGWTLSDLVTYADNRAADAQPVAVEQLAQTIADLGAAGYSLGVATNDSEAAARAHLRGLDLNAAFVQIIGADSGFAAKPAPDMLLGFADRVGVRPNRLVMVGDSTHDLEAAQRAGACPVGVLTGPAGHDDLAPFAEVVLPSIAELPNWLANC